MKNHPSAAAWLELKPHATTPSPMIESLHACAILTNKGEIEASYKLTGQTGRVLWPALKPSGLREGLWRTTCFELFIAPSETKNYWEFNFSPSHEWCAYAFNDYRAGQTLIHQLDFSQFHVTCTENIATLQVRFSPNPSLARLLKDTQIGLSAVIESVDGDLSYWALTHPAARPDFHDRRGFCESLSKEKDYR